MSDTVITGNEVEINYVGKLKDQTVFDSTLENKPFKFIIGSPYILKGFSDAVIGMKVGDKKTIELSSDNAYGPYKDELVSKVSRNNIPENAKVGEVLIDTNENPWWIRQINDDFAIIDGNHPLAGHDLIFEIELLKIFN